MIKTAIATILTISLVGCGDKQQPQQAQQEPQKQEAKGVDHYYAMNEDGAYGYERAPSEEDIKQGRLATSLIMVRFVGEKDGKWQAANEDGSIVTVFECSKPCEFIKVMAFNLEAEGQALNVERIRVQPGIVAYSIMQDAINGKLKDRMGLRKNGKDYSVWFDEKKGPILTASGK